MRLLESTYLNARHSLGFLLRLATYTQLLRPYLLVQGYQQHYPLKTEEAVMYGIKNLEALTQI